VSLEETEVVILGAGLAGLTAASVLGDSGVVLERSDRPGGLVKTECFDGYWFDHVLHLLYFDDAETEVRIRRLLGADLAPCPPQAWVETKYGTTRFPIQFHLSGLEKDAVVACLLELAERAHRPAPHRSDDFEQMLLRAFGPTMCKVFHFPYNRKVWKRRLCDLAPSEFTWNIVPTELEKALRGALMPEKHYPGYNAEGWYPRPPARSPVRGMEVLTRHLASQVPNLLLEHEVVEVDLDAQTVTARWNGSVVRYRFLDECCSTIPLPQLLRICRQTPRAVLERLDRLTRNRVLTAAFSVKGPRPEGTGHWRYYADESLIFTRLIYMHEFDPLSAPRDGWGLMAEIVEPAEGPIRPRGEIFNRVRADIARLGALPRDCHIIDQNLIVVDPAYAVFSLENQDLLNDARDFLAERGVTLLGRYGRWSYTSMAQVMRRAQRWAQKTQEALPSRRYARRRHGRYVPACREPVAEEV
jgi:protoporphyrinogen oxidase